MEQLQPQLRETRRTRSIYLQKKQTYEEKLREMRVAHQEMENAKQIWKEKRHALRQAEKNYQFLPERNPQGQFSQIYATEDERSEAKKERQRRYRYKLKWLKTKNAAAVEDEPEVAAIRIAQYTPCAYCENDFSPDHMRQEQGENRDAFGELWIKCQSCHRWTEEECMSLLERTNMQNFKCRFCSTEQTTERRVTRSRKPAAEKAQGKRA